MPGKWPEPPNKVQKNTIGRDLNLDNSTHYHLPPRAPLPVGHWKSIVRIAIFFGTITFLVWTGGSRNQLPRSLEWCVLFSAVWWGLAKWAKSAPEREVAAPTGLGLLFVRLSLTDRPPWVQFWSFLLFACSLAFVRNAEESKPPPVTSGRDAGGASSVEVTADAPKQSASAIASGAPRLRPEGSQVRAIPQTRPPWLPNESGKFDPNTVVQIAPHMVIGATNGDFSPFESVKADYTDADGGFHHVELAFPKSDE